MPKPSLAKAFVHRIMFGQQWCSYHADEKQEELLHTKIHLDIYIPNRPSPKPFPSIILLLPNFSCYTLHFSRGNRACHRFATVLRSTPSISLIVHGVEIPTRRIYRMLISQAAKGDMTQIARQQPKPCNDALPLSQILPSIRFTIIVPRVPLVWCKWIHMEYKSTVSSWKATML